ncbi:MAG: GH3 auxin-responsive promoter family protein, partial [Phycisphaerae bacterium]
MAARPLIDRLIARSAMVCARRASRRFLAVAHDAEAAQSRHLTRLLARDAESDFGREHHFTRIRRYADFIANVPIRTYADLAPYIERLRQGDTRALLGPKRTLVMFALTSGTTAKSKYVPVTRETHADWQAGWNIWGSKVISDHPDAVLRDIVQVTSPMNDHRSPGGVPCGAITGLLAGTQKKLVRRYYVAPLDVAGIRDSAARYYTIMRLAIPRDVGFVVTANPATILLLARTADEHRDEIIRDIHDGTLETEWSVSSHIRTALAPRLTPQPACARRLESLVQRHGALLPRHYWNLGFRAHWTGGTMGLYEPQFPKYFGPTPVRDIGLLASEGRMSIPIEDHTPSGVLAVTSQFFEFIPAEEYGSPNPTVERCHQLRTGRDYFLILTNSSGLYRYDLGDRVRVTGWLGQAPLIEFRSRDAHTASLAGEKLTEDQVVMAMKRVCQTQGRAVVRFVLAPRWDDPPHYRLYVDSDVAERRCSIATSLDDALCEISLEYESKRKTLRLGPVELVELSPGVLTD